MEDLYLNVTLAALQDRDTGIKTFAKKSVLSKKVKHCFYGAQFTESMRQFGIEDKVKALEIGQRLYDAGYIAAFEAKDRTTGVNEAQIYFWSEVVVMERKVIENNFGLALNYFLEHSYRRGAKTDDEGKSQGLLKRLRGIVDDVQAPTPPPPVAPPTATLSRRMGSSAGTISIPQTHPQSSMPVLAPTPVVPPVVVAESGPDTMEEDTNEIKFFLSPEDPNPVVKAATLEKLIERLTYEAYIDMRFRQQFLITYRSFTTPVALLEKLRERFHLYEGNPPGSDEKAEWERHRKLLQLRVLTVLSRWLADLFEDFVESADLSAAFLSLLDEVQPTNVATLGNQLRATFTTKMEQHRADPVEFTVHETVVGQPTGFSFDDTSIPDLAQQLTMYEHQLFIQITRDEFLGLKWSKSGKNEKARNVLRYINHFNRLSSWVVREIITKFNLKQRSVLLLKFVQLAVKFREYNNFSSSMCILAALVSSPVRRLKATWAEVPQEWLERMSGLETLFAHNMSYKAYRETIQKIVPPCIPYLGLYLTDLTFIEEANPDKVDGLINFQKQIMISKVIEDIRRFQAAPYKNFSLTTAVKNWVGNLQGFERDEEAYQLSLKIEPRNAAVTLESMLVEEDRLRKQLHQSEIRISDLESENRRLKDQLAQLDADLRVQIRRGTETSDGAPDDENGTPMQSRRVAGSRSYHSLKLAIPFLSPPTSPPPQLVGHSFDSAAALHANGTATSQPTLIPAPPAAQPPPAPAQTGAPAAAATATVGAGVVKTLSKEDAPAVTPAPTHTAAIVKNFFPQTPNQIRIRPSAPAPILSAHERSQSDQNKSNESKTPARTGFSPSRSNYSPSRAAPTESPPPERRAGAGGSAAPAPGAPSTTTVTTTGSGTPHSPLIKPQPPRFMSVPPLGADLPAPGSPDRSGSDSRTPPSASDQRAASPQRPASPRGPKLSPRGASPRLSPRLGAAAAVGEEAPPPIPPFAFPAGVDLALSSLATVEQLEKAGNRLGRIIFNPPRHDSPKDNATPEKQKLNNSNSANPQVSPAVTGKKLPPVPPKKN